MPRPRRVGTMGFRRKSHRSQSSRGTSSLVVLPTKILSPGWSTLINSDWAANGKGLFTSSPVQRGSVLLYVDLRGIAHPLWEQRGSSATWAIASPDWRHLALSGRTTTTNFWLLENF